MHRQLMSGRIVGSALVILAALVSSIPPLMVAQPARAQEAADSGPAAELARFAREVREAKCQDLARDGGSLIENWWRQWFPSAARPVSVAIAGFDRKLRSLDEGNARRILTDIEQVLGREGIVISSLGDWSRLLDVHFDTGGAPALRGLSSDLNAIKADLILFAYVERRLPDGYVDVVVSTVTPRNSCKSVRRIERISLTETIERPEQVIGRCVARLLERRSTVGQLRVKILPPRSDGEALPPPNSSHLKGLFENELLQEARKSQNLASGPLDVQVIGPLVAGEAEGAYRAQLETVSSPKGVRLHCAITGSGGESIANEAVLIDIAGFPDARALTVARAITLRAASSELRPGMTLGFNAYIKQRRRLYCALESASAKEVRVYVLFPASKGDLERAFGPNEKEVALLKELGFPDNAFEVKEAGRETLRCFALVQRAPRNIEGDWIAQSALARMQAAEQKGTKGEAELAEAMPISIDAARPLYARLRGLQAEEVEVAVETKVK